MNHQSSQNYIKLSWLSSLILSNRQELEMFINEIHSTCVPFAKPGAPQTTYPPWSPLLDVADFTDQIRKASLLAENNLSESTKRFFGGSGFTREAGEMSWFFTGVPWLICAIFGERKRIAIFNKISVLHGTLQSDGNIMLWISIDKYVYCKYNCVCRWCASEFIYGWYLPSCKQHKVTQSHHPSAILFCKAAFVSNKNLRGPQWLWHNFCHVLLAPLAYCS